MNLSRILSHVRNSWRTLAACAVAGLLIGGVATLIQGPTYDAKSTVLVSPYGALGGLGAAPGADGYYIAQRTQAYADLAKSPRVLTAAAEAAGLDELTESSVKVDWMATSPASLTITVSAPTARDAEAGANAVGKSLADVVAFIERPPNGGNPAVRVSLSSAAEPPTSPVSPDPVINLLLGLVVGLAVGFPLVLARLLLGRGISDGAALREAIGEAPLGVIGAADDKGGLILREAPRSKPAEELRKLRTSVRFAKPDAAAHSIVVTAPHLGAGATTVACNLALAMAETGQRVVLVEANLRDPAVSDLFRLDAGPGLADVLSGEVDVDAVLRPGGTAGLMVLTAGQTAAEPGSVLAGSRMVALLERLEQQSDVVIIDAPPVLPYAEAGELSAIADAALLVARYSETKISDLREARATLAHVGTTVLGVVINGAPGADSADAVSSSTPPARPSSSPAPELADNPSR